MTTQPLSPDPVPLSRPATARPRAATAALRARPHGRDQVLLEGARPGGLVLCGLSDAEARAILDLGPAVHPDRLVRAPVSSKRWSDVVGLVRVAAGSLAPPARSTGRVAVVGNGPVPREIVRALRPSTAHVLADDALIARLEQGMSAPAKLPDVAILTAVDALPPGAGARWDRLGVRQLPVIVSGDRLSIGPAITAGAGPCLHCLDLHRADRDPGFAAWSVTRPGVTGLHDEIDAPPVIRAAAAGLVALVVRGVLTGRPLPAGVSISVHSPHPRVRHHLWPMHPACCGGPGGQETMHA